MKAHHRVLGILLLLGISFALSAQQNEGSAFLSGKVIFAKDSIYPLIPRSVILQKEWPITYSQFEEQPIDSTDYTFEIRMDPEQLTYGHIIINFYSDIDSTALERQGHWSREQHEALEVKMKDKVARAWKEAITFGTMTEPPFLDVELMFEDVFAEMPRHLQRQRDKMLAMREDAS